MTPTMKSVAMTSCQHHRHHYARHPEDNDDQSEDEQPFGAVFGIDAWGT
jgi:hypothetical protein